MKTKVLLIAVWVVLLVGTVQANLYLTADGEKVVPVPPRQLGLVPPPGCRWAPLEMFVGESVTIGVWNDDDAMTSEVNWLTIPYGWGIKPLSELAEPIPFSAAGDEANVRGPYFWQVEPLSNSYWAGCSFIGWRIESKGWMEGINNTIVAGLHFESEFTYLGDVIKGIRGLSEEGLHIVLFGPYTVNHVRDTISVVPAIPEPATPPVADADGPYSIYVGDTLTLDANDSTDADGDIVSYMWDLDDNGSFETDAGGQAIFDVNYAYLQSLGLLVDYLYDIHVQVTDSEGQSDIADSMLIIVPKPAIVVAVDIKPGSCPNPVNVKSSGVLPIAILGTEDVNVITIDPTSIRLAGVEPLRSGYEDVAGPVSDSNDCNCITEGPDGFLDLTLKFKTQRIVEAIGEVNDGDVRVLTLTGVLFDPMPFETPIEGADCILIRGRHKPINPADINKDGVVNAADFAIIAENWLQSTIVDD